MSKGKILFQLTGSIACYKACSLISRLVQEGFEVQTAVTPGALQFIGESTLEGLTSRPVLKDTYERGRTMDHIHVPQWADLALLCPATASTINRLAAGVGDDFISTVFLAYPLQKKPYLIAPAMNQQMYSHPATQSSLRRLKDWGVHVLPTGSGYQACGDVGEGRLLEPDEMLEVILKFFELERHCEKQKERRDEGLSDSQSHVQDHARCVAGEMRT